MVLKRFLCPDGLTRQYADGEQPDGCVPADEPKKAPKHSTRKAGAKDEG